ncbi:MAG: hypothetical protein HY899_11895 [Deltaproteobacteria bacterium]|nr:hypothetical protein [Deltaproteobacteria bacterium]
MTGLIAAALIALVAVIIAAPLWRTDLDQAAVEPSVSDELWKHEKAVALLAITEADFDRATGKLSDDDYTVLREDYEDRALRAIDELEKLDASPAPPAEVSARFCGNCGTRFGSADRYCSSCGTPRG